MTKLTAKQEKFVKAKLAGLPNKESAIQAGYSEVTADVQAGRMVSHPKIKAALAAGGYTKRGQVAEVDEDADIGLRDDYPDSLSFLRAVYNNSKASKSMRLSAAVAALPYEHAKIGEKGKKEKRQEDAGKQAAEGRFQTGRAPRGRPTLRAV